MFLFDKFKTSQQPFYSGDGNISVRWKTYLKTFPHFAAESTAAIDTDGNFYFGSHSGNFYSLDINGTIRWSFSTEKKIYGSPFLHKDKVYFIGGDGIAYCLCQNNGEIHWTKDLKEGYYDNAQQKLYQEIVNIKYTLNVKRKMLMNTKSWSSPTFVNGQVIVTGFGKGLYALNAENGEEVWSKDWGFPRYQLCGVVLDEDNNIYSVSRKGYTFCYDSNGNEHWSKKVAKGWSAWGNPTYNSHRKQVYYPFSIGEQKGIIIAQGKNGEIIWKTKLSKAIHGCVAISSDNNLYCADFAGFIYKIDSINGQILKQVKVSNAVRALWTTPTIDPNNDVYISTKDSIITGRIIKFDSDLNEKWSYKTNKVLSIPVILENGDICFGGWDGYYYCLKTK